MEIDSELDLYTRVERALDNIRPYLVTDGGDVKLVKITEDRIVHIELLGACESCPMSPMTMKAGIEEAIKRVAPEIKSIKAINFD
jgi:Fe-S cluster biogenesis protein NfuA